MPIDPEPSTDCSRYRPATTRARPGSGSAEPGVSVVAAASAGSCSEVDTRLLWRSARARSRAAACRRKHVNRD
ncbi:hypothetical protein GCM10027521_48560 [Amycolatopsis cihanbeyliensis]